MSTSSRPLSKRDCVDLPAPDHRSRLMDATRTRFAEECRRQSAIVAAADLADRDLTDFMDSALEDMQRPNE